MLGVQFCVTVYISKVVKYVVLKFNQIFVKY
jgi:hypothetical protein